MRNGNSTNDPEDAAHKQMSPIAQHMRTNHCLPYPAGPRLARPAPDAPALVTAHMGAEERASRCLQLFALCYPQLGSTGTKNAISTHVFDSIREWLERHPSFAEQAGGDPATAVLWPLTEIHAGMHSAATASHGGVDAAKKLIALLRDSRRQSANRVRRGSQTAHACTAEGQVSGAAAAPTPRAPHGVHLDEHAGHSLTTSAQRKAVADTVMKGGGIEPLLLLYFLKVLHSELGYMPKKEHSGPALGSFYIQVLWLLQVSACSQSELAEVANLLAGHIKRVSPFFVIAEKKLDMERQIRAYRHEPGTVLPDCFDPYRLEPGLSPRFAQSYLDMHHIPTSARQAPFSAAQIELLGIEIASLFTDPLLASRLRFQQKFYKHIFNGLRYDGGIKKGEASTFARSREERRRIFKSYAEWMEKEGFAHISSLDASSEKGGQP